MAVNKEKTKDGQRWKERDPAVGTKSETHVRCNELAASSMRSG